MMFTEMAAANLYPPKYSQSTTGAAVECVTVTLFNLARPSTWDLVSDWVDRNGTITNRKLREMSSLDTLAASKQLRAWVAQGLLIALPTASRQGASYSKPDASAVPGDSLSSALDND